MEFFMAVIEKAIIISVHIMMWEFGIKKTWNYMLDENK